MAPSQNINEWIAMLSFPYALRSPDLNELIAKADAVRREFVGDRVYLRGLIEFSNYCRCNCLYCGLRKDNFKVRRFRLSDEEILQAARKAHKAGVDTIVLQSGEDMAYSDERIASLVTRIKEETGLALTLSLGDRAWKAFDLWRKAGADRYLIKHESADPKLYARMHPGASLDKRLEALCSLGDLGYEVGTGFIIGLPGQTRDILLQDIALTKELKAVMCGVGPFLPQKNTPLGDQASGEIEETLFAIASLRSEIPLINLPATTAIASLSPMGHELALRAGANVIMPNFTPPAQRKYYSIYDGKIGVEIKAAHKAIESTGRFYKKVGI